MFNLQKQIEYWKNSALSDIETAEILIEKGKFHHGLFFRHLTIEKMLKANYVKANLKLAPKTHNLFYLLDNTNLILNDSSIKFPGILLKYQLEGRYPEYEISTPTKEDAQNYLREKKGLLKWLTQKL